MSQANLQGSNINQVKLHNLQVVLLSLLYEPVLSRVQLARRTNLSNTTITNLIAEEREATGSRMYVPSGARAFEGEVMKKVKEFWQRWFRPSKGLPKASWEALKKWHNEFRATMFRFDQKMKRLEDKVNNLTKGSDRLTNAVFQQINNVLNGTQAGDLPIAQPTRFELVINRRTARALGLEIPASLILQASRVFE